MKIVTEKVIEIHDRGEISCDVAKELIVTARKAVHCCDGDEDDVIDAIRMCRCGRCLKKRDEGENFYSIRDISGGEIKRNEIKIGEKIEWNDIMTGEKIVQSDVVTKEKAEQDDIISNGGELLASDVLCASCFDVVINRSFRDERAGEREREYIDQCRKGSKNSR